MSHWLTLSEEVIVEFVKALNKLKVLVSQNKYPVIVPFGLIKKFQAMRNWAKEHLHCQQVINKAAFDVSDMHASDFGPHGLRSSTQIQQAGGTIIAWQVCVI
jgi:hypothetical protein